MFSDRSIEEPMVCCCSRLWVTKLRLFNFWFLLDVDAYHFLKDLTCHFGPKRQLRKNSEFGKPPNHTSYILQRKWNKVTDLKAKVNLHCQNFATLVKFNQNRSHRLFMSKTMESNRNGMMPYMCCIIFCAFHKHNSFPLGPKKAFISIYYLKSSMAELFHCVALFRDHPRPSISG